MRVSSQPGFFGNFLPIIDGKKTVCRHFHRTAKGAERCGKEIARFQEKVARLKKDCDEKSI